MSNAITLLNGDFLEISKTFPDCCVDLVVTDPPYRLIPGGKPNVKKGAPSGILKKNDGKIFDHNDIAPEQWIPEVYRILKDDCQCYIMVNVLNMENYLRICRETGFQLHNILVWEKNNATPNKWYMKNCEFTLFFRKGKSKFINNCGSKQVHQFYNIIGNKSHPTEKPVDLMELYIENSSKENDIVLDPFMGCGSTGIAAKNLRRCFIGIEIDENYYMTAKNRIEGGGIIIEKVNSRTEKISS